MISLFAGVDKNGDIRFVQDVPSGLACGCFCDACGCPLVARRGEIRQWHFGHEARQERPECQAGAVNLLRRLAIERLQNRVHWTLPAYVEKVFTRPPLPWVGGTAQWLPTLARTRDWRVRGPRHERVAWLELGDGCEVALHVDVSDQAGAVQPSRRQRIGAIRYVIPMPHGNQVRSLAEARTFIESGHLEWLRYPDVEGRIEALQIELDERANKHKTREAENQAHLQAHRAAVFGSARLPQQRGRDGEPTASVPQSAKPPSFDLSPWASWRKPRSAMSLWGFTDGTGWVLVTHQDGRHVLVPWPLVDGWDEALPARLGEADWALGGMVTPRFQAAIEYMNAQNPPCVRTTSNWTELEAIRWGSNASTDAQQ